MQKEYEIKKAAFQKADKNAFNIYRLLENIEDELEITEKKISDLKRDSLTLQNQKSETERKNIQITLNYEQENIKLNSYNQDLVSKKDDLERVKSEIGPLISEEIIKIRPIEDIKSDRVRKSQKKRDLLKRSRFLFPHF